MLEIVKIQMPKSVVWCTAVSSLGFDGKTLIDWSLINLLVRWKSQGLLLPAEAAAGLMGFYSLITNAS